MGQQPGWPGRCPQLRECYEICIWSGAQLPESHGLRSEHSFHTLGLQQVSRSSADPSHLLNVRLYLKEISRRWCYGECRWKQPCLSCRLVLFEHEMAFSSHLSDCSCNRWCGQSCPLIGTSSSPVWKDYRVPCICTFPLVLSEPQTMLSDTRLLHSCWLLQLCIAVHDVSTSFPMDFLHFDGTGEELILTALSKLLRFLGDWECH